MRTDMRVGTCADMCTDMCIDMRINMCTDMCVRIRTKTKQPAPSVPPPGVRALACRRVYRNVYACIDVWVRQLAAQQLGTGAWLYQLYIGSTAALN